MRQSSLFSHTNVESHSIDSRRCRSRRIPFTLQPMTIQYSSTQLNTSRHHSIHSLGVLFLTGDASCRPTLRPPPPIISGPSPFPLSHVHGTDYFPSTARTKDSFQVRNHILITIILVAIITQPAQCWFSGRRSEECPGTTSLPVDSHVPQPFHGDSPTR